MNATTKIAAFVVWLAIVFGAGLGVGNVVGPIDTGSPMEHGSIR